MQGDIDAYMANVKKFTEKTGIEVRVDNEGWEDVRPKAAVAANTGAGPDIILSTNDDANLYPGQAARRDRPVPTTSARSTAAGTRPCEAYLRPDGKKWIGVPLGAAGAMMVYRESMVKAAGFDTLPEGHRRLPEAVQGAARTRARPAAWRWATPPATAAGRTG